MNPYSSESPDGEFEYGLSTPWKAVVNGAWIIGKKGFVSTDIEYVDYTSAKYDFTTNSDAIEDRNYQDEVNAEIKEIYKGTVNVKVGGELAMRVFVLEQVSNCWVGLLLVTIPLNLCSQLESGYAVTRLF